MKKFKLTLLTIFFGVLIILAVLSFITAVVDFSDVPRSIITIIGSVFVFVAATLWILYTYIYDLNSYRIVKEENKEDKDTLDKEVIQEENKIENKDKE